jgi:hypothetical protein
LVSFSWIIKKHSKPYKDEIIQMPPLNEEGDIYRSTTLIPYLEDMHRHDLLMAPEDQGTVVGDHVESASNHTDHENHRATEGLCHLSIHYGTIVKECIS